MNTRSMTLWYLVAVLGLSAIGVVGIVALEYLRPDVDRGLIVSIFGFLAPTVVALLALIRGEANGQQLADVQQKAAAAAVQADAAKHVAVVVREDVAANTAMTAEVAAKVNQMVNGKGTLP